MIPGMMPTTIIIGDAATTNINETFTPRRKAYSAGPSIRGMCLPYFPNKRVRSLSSVDDTDIGLLAILKAFTSPSRERPPGTTLHLGRGTPSGAPRKTAPRSAPGDVRPSSPPEPVPERFLGGDRSPQGPRQTPADEVGSQVNVTSIFHGLIDGAQTHSRRPALSSCRLCELLERPGRVPRLCIRHGI